LALIEGCKHSLEISVPAAEVEAETARAVESIQKRAKIPGFRPGKTPAGIIRRQFASDIRSKVIEALVPRHFEKELKREELRLVGDPTVTDVHLYDGEDFHFKAEFEVAPEIELKEYRGLSVAYSEPSVAESDVDDRLEQLRERKANFANVDPRPIENGDYAVIALESIGGTDGEPVKQDEMTLHVGDESTLAAFSTNLAGMTPGEEKSFDVAYPENYASEKLAGKTVSFHAVVKGIRRKELPELNDEFAMDIGDFRGLTELREALRKAIYAEREHENQQRAKNALVESLVNLHDFPVPEVFIERQVRNRVEQTLHGMAAQGMDLSKLTLDWKKVMNDEQERGRAVREVKASLLLSKVSERESIFASREEVDREVDRLSRQHREPAAALRIRLQKDGTLGRIASHIQTEKTLNFLFEHATKTAEEPAEASAEHA
jgi:trigger factor